jgi:hypothetical protein
VVKKPEAKPGNPVGRLKPLPLMSLMGQQQQLQQEGKSRRSPAYAQQQSRSSPKKGYDGDGFRYIIHFRASPSGHLPSTHGLYPCEWLYFTI